LRVWREIAREKLPQNAVVARMIWVGVGRTGAEQGEPLSATHIQMRMYLACGPPRKAPYNPKKKGAKWRGKSASTGATLPYAHDARGSRRWRAGRWFMERIFIQRTKSGSSIE